MLHSFANHQTNEPQRVPAVDDEHPLQLDGYVDSGAGRAFEPAVRLALQPRSVVDEPLLKGALADGAVALVARGPEGRAVVVGESVCGGAQRDYNHSTTYYTTLLQQYGIIYT